MYWISLTNKLSTGNIAVDLKFFSSALYDGNEDHLFIDLDKISIGSERENDSILNVNNVEIEMKLDGVTFEKYANILYELNTIRVTVQVYLDNLPIFGGYIQQNSIKGDLFTHQIKFRAVNQLNNLKLEDPKTNPLGYGTTEKVKLITILEDILTTDTFFEFPFVDEVVSLCTYRAKISGGSTRYNFEDFGVVAYEHYFNPSGILDTLLDVVKQICFTYGCIGYVGMDAKFYLVPRVYQANDFYTIENYRIKEIDISVIRKMLGLSVSVFTGTPGAYQIYDYGDVTTDPEFVEEIILDNSVGLLPTGGGSASNLFLWNGSTWDTADFNSVSRKQTDGTYTSDKSLWRLTGDDTWALINKDRINYKVSVPGDWDSFTKKSKLLTDHGPKQFYKLSLFPDSYLKPRQFKFDMVGNNVEIDMQSQ